MTHIVAVLPQALSYTVWGYHSLNSLLPQDLGLQPQNSTQWYPEAKWIEMPINLFL